MYYTTMDEFGALLQASGHIIMYVFAGTFPQSILPHESIGANDKQPENNLLFYTNVL